MSSTFISLLLLLLWKSIQKVLIDWRCQIVDSLLIIYECSLWLVNRWCDLSCWIEFVSCIVKKYLTIDAFCQALRFFIIEEAKCLFVLLLFERWKIKTLILALKNHWVLYVFDFLHEFYRVLTDGICLHSGLIISCVGLCLLYVLVLKHGWNN